MSIRIGNKNKIKKSSIGHQYNINGNNEKPLKKKKLNEKHPFLFNFFISLLVGFILLFSFWNPIISWIEGIFN
ncbi:hypothetical protein GLW07_21880 [Bacillus hwajinpoensis]|uniref:Uncharacterized protein n=1 Tax=Guptibacillus hwajinpoensis TaxID=208199 RepID=A0A845F4I5_9BACL|nr:hypothetical protein [Pseudalkalibacillus hwajinpoensis]MYL65992.1 hypothetical protein [Pseudalkalibacillus hwajinpoensis]